jgi:hypothetical protein
MMSHHQGNRVLVLPLGNPLQTLLKRRKALKYALRKQEYVVWLWNVKTAR